MKLLELDNNILTSPHSILSTLTELQLCDYCQMYRGDFFGSMQTGNISNYYIYLPLVTHLYHLITYSYVRKLGVYN